MARPSRLVTGKFIAYGEDGPDAGNLPDRIPMVGLVVQFNPSIPRIPDFTIPETAFLRPIIGVTNEYGVLCDLEGNEGVRVPVTSPQNFTYSVRIIPPDGSWVQPYTFPILLPDSSEPLDITEAIPAPIDPDKDFSAWLEVVAQVTALRDEAAAIVAGVGPQIVDLVGEALDENLENTVSVMVGNIAESTVNQAVINKDLLRRQEVFGAGIGTTTTDYKAAVTDVNDLPTWARFSEDQSKVPPSTLEIFNQNGIPLLLKKTVNGFVITDLDDKETWIGSTEHGTPTENAKWAIVDAVGFFCGREVPYAYPGKTIIWYPTDASGYPLGIMRYVRNPE